MQARMLIAALCAGAICTGAQAEELYRLAQGDQIELWSSVDASLRRTMTIGPDGWLSLPLAGHLQGAGRTLPELEGEIKGKLSRFFKDEPDVTLMLAPNAERILSIYVSGDVATPGAYPFQPGLLVAHSVSMAGGVRRAAAVSDEERSITISGTIGRHKARISALAAQAARIEAEKDDVRIVEAAAGDADIAREQAILDTRIADRDERAKAHTERLALRQELVNAVTEQANAVQLQIKLSEERLKGIAKLVNKGFANQVQEIEIRSGIADLEASRHELDGQIVAARLAVATEVEDFREAQAADRSQLMIDLRDTQREQSVELSSLKDSERVLRLLEMEAPQDEEEERPVIFRIVRTANGSPVEIEASDMSVLQPGDLVRVTRSGEAATPTPAAVNGIANEQRSPS